MIDVHAHLTDAKYEEDLEEILFNSSENGIEKIISAGYDVVSSQKAIELSEIYQPIYATIGVHPENVNDFDEDSIETLKKLSKNKKVVAVGEIGLDYHYFSDLNENEIIKLKEKQKDIFVKQIELANELELPIVVHSRDAIGDTIEILKTHKPKRASLIHCFSGSVESAKILLQLGYSFSFGGVVTFKNARQALDVVEMLPIEKILLETDCPYLSPEPFRGKRNEPKNIVYVADKIAKIKNLSIEEVALRTTENASLLFFQKKK